ncbi:MAG: class I SAM-dependent methyltransferase [Chthoniobacter sp.]
MRPELAANAYDAIPYPGAVQNWTHPDQLATKALLAGLRPAALESCRVLELGCGDGTNLTNMAFGLPGGRFLGIDLARKPLEGAIALAEKLGIKNLEFRCADILGLGSDLGEFDFIVIPGLYSWVPAAVRDKLLELCGQCLAPHGVAVVSYNAYPGSFASNMVREMMAYQVRSIEDPAKQIRQARGLVNLLLRCQGEPKAYKAALEQEMKRIAGYSDGVLFHDDLNPHYHPVYFHQFMEHAGRHGLQYLGERCENALDAGDYPEQIRPALRQLSECGIIEREQYLDFIHGRRFRCTFLCREEAAPQRGIEVGQLNDLRVGISREMDVNILIDADGLRFVSDEATLASTNHPLIVAAVSYLLQERPRSVPFAELLEAAQADENVTEANVTDPERDARMLGAFVLRCYLTRLLDLGTWQPPCVAHPSARPVASALARALVRCTPLVPSLRHDCVAILDELGHRLLELLDGTHDRSSLLAELNAIVATNHLPLPDGATAVTPAMVEEKLEALARLGLLSD